MSFMFSDLQQFARNARFVQVSIRPAWPACDPKDLRTPFEEPYKETRMRNPKKGWSEVKQLEI